MLNDDDDDGDSATTLGNASNALLDDDDNDHDDDESSHASSALLGFTPLKNRLSPASFISPATHTLNILSQQDTNNLRYDFSQMENDAAAVSSQRSPFSPRQQSSPPAKQTTIDSPSPARKENQASWPPTKDEPGSPEPSDVAKELAAFEKHAGVSILATHLQKLPTTTKTAARVVTNNTKHSAPIEVTAESVLLSSKIQETSTPVTVVLTSTNTVTIKNDPPPIIDLMHVDEHDALNKLRVHRVVFSQPGSLGIAIQHVDLAGLQLCKVKSLYMGMQAQGKVQIGDFFCTSSSSDACKFWLSHDQCLELVKLERPLVLCVARDPTIIDTTTTTSSATATATNDACATSSDVLPSSITLAPSRTNTTTTSKNEGSLVTLAAAAAFVHAQKMYASSKTTTRSGVDPLLATSTDNTLTDKRSSSTKSSGGSPLAKLEVAGADKVLVVTSNKAKAGRAMAGSTSATALSTTASVSKPTNNGTNPDQHDTILYLKHNSHDVSKDASKISLRNPRNGTAEDCSACTLKQEWETNKHVCKRGLELRWKLLQDGTRVNCRGCQFELERGWGTNKRFSHTCVRARKKVVGPNNDGAVVATLAGDDVPTKRATAVHPLKFDDLITIPYCLACQRGTEKHHALCPQRPGFQGSHEKQLLEKIYQGVQIGCKNCLATFETGKVNRGIHHAMDCPKRFGKGAASSDAPTPAEISDFAVKPQSTRDAVSASRTDLPTTIACCPACRDGATKSHHRWCPQHPAFVTSGASLHFEKICRGTQVCCANCKFEFERGRQCGLPHSTNCSRRKGFRPVRTLQYNNDAGLEIQTEAKKSVVPVVDLPEENRDRENSSKASQSLSQLEMSEEICVKKANIVLETSISQLGFIAKDDEVVPRKSNTEAAPTIILQLDQTIDIGKIEVPFCFACRKKSMIHNALCPKHPHFEQSGAADKLELIRRGLNIGCQVCVFHFNKGYPDKNLEHSDDCECKPPSKSDEMKVASVAAPKSKTRKTAGDARTTNDILPTTKKLKQLLPKETSTSSKGRRVIMSEKAKSALFDLSDAASLSSERSNSLSSERSNWKPKEKGNHHIRSLLAPLTKNPIEIKMAQNKTVKGPPPVSRKKDSNQAPSCKVQTLPVPTNSDTVKPRWMKASNPWGSSEHREGDVVLALPIDGFTSHEVAFSGKRFVEKPFAYNSPYKETHVLPEDGVQFLQLSRDRLGLTPWGFTFALHEFGGACLVTNVDSMSPASNAVVHGSTTAASLNVHDLILSVNGSDIGGMTELGLEIELEVSGPDVLVAMSRYRFAALEERENQAKEKATLESFEEKLRDKKQLGWHELTLMGDDLQLLSPLKGHEATDADADIGEEMEPPPRKPAQMKTTIFFADDDDLETDVDRSDDQSKRELVEKQPLPQKQHSANALEAMVFDPGSAIAGDTHETKPTTAGERDDPCPGETTCYVEKGVQESTVGDECESVDEYDNDENIWSGCVCGEIHEPPIPVFWIQCDRCDTWLNVWERCIRVSEEEAAQLSRFICWSCHPPDMPDEKEKEAAIVVANSKEITFMGISEGNEVMCAVSMPVRVDGSMNAQPVSAHRDPRELSRDRKNRSLNPGPRKRRQRGDSPMKPEEKRRMIEVGELVEVAKRTWIGINELGGVGRVLDVTTRGDGNSLYDIKYVIGTRTEFGIDAKWVKVHDFFLTPARRSLTRNSVEN